MAKRVFFLKRFRNNKPQNILFLKKARKKHWFERLQYTMSAKKSWRETVFFLQIFSYVLLRDFKLVPERRDMFLSHFFTNYTFVVSLHVFAHYQRISSECCKKYGWQLLSRLNVLAKRWYYASVFSTHSVRHWNTQKINTLLRIIVHCHLTVEKNGFCWW